VRIESSAPTRIDLAGGTIDIWPLYLHHDQAQTLNAAISLRARCSVSPRHDRRVVIVSEDSGQTVDADRWSDLPAGGPLPLLSLLVRHFRADGLQLATSSDSPMGAGIAGSSALNIAVSAALSAWTRAPLDPEALMQIAMNVEAQAIAVPTGAQDYRPAVYGGVSAVELDADGVRRVALPVDPAELDERLVLAYTGASRHSGINNWEVTKRHIDGDRRVFDCFERIRDVAVAMREALVRGDWTEVGRQIAAEWENRKALAPGVSTPLIEDLIARARAAGAAAAKVCGAGGGGCLVCFGEPRVMPAVRDALRAGRAQVLDFHIEREGLRVVTSADHGYTR
jgi:D-glycero-alpha-D-manno-heptose-7-phosphate kinase